MQNVTAQTQTPNSIEEDEIDLRELFKTIVDGKKIILLITVIIVSLTLVYALKLPNSYKSYAVLIPSEGDKSASLGGLEGSLLWLAFP